MRSIFRTLRDEERAEALEAYASFLAHRDGGADFDRRVLTRREEATRRFEQPEVVYDAPVSREAFDALLASSNRRAAIPDDVLLLLALVKTNANEAFAVDYVMRRKSRLTGRAAEIERIVLLEETYHTRLLVSAAALVGLTVQRKLAPVRSVRAMIGVIADLPDRASRPTTLAGEAVGILTFLRTIGAIRRVHRDRPELRDALEERVTEVLVDEVGHLAFNRILAGPTELRLARAALPLVALGTHGALHEAEALGILPLPRPEVAAFGFETLPDEVRRRAFVA